MSFSLTLAVYKVNGGGESITSFEVENPPGRGQFGYRKLLYVKVVF